MAEQTMEVVPFDVAELREHIGSAPEVYEDLASRSAKAVEAGRDLLAQAQQDGMDDELSQKFVDYIKRAKSTIELASGKRKPITQMFQMATKAFTSLENDIKEVSKQLKEVLDQYAAQKEKERQEKQEAERRAAAKKKELETLKAEAEKGLRYAFVNVRSTHEEALKALLASMTLDSIGDYPGVIDEYPEELPVKELKWPKFEPVHVSEDELKEIKKEVGLSMSSSLREEFTTAITDLKKELVDLIPSKAAELKEEKRLKEEAEAARKAAEEAEKKRQEAIAKANAEQKKKLEAEAKAAREAEAKRQAELKAQQEKLEAEKKAREEEEKKQAAERAEEERKKADQQAQARAEAAEMSSLFDVEQAASETQVPKGSATYTIVVKHQQGYAEMFALWFAKEGGNLPMDKLEKMTLKRVREYFERLASKDGEKMESKFFTYKEGYKTSVRR